MQGHKRTARSERLGLDSHETSGNATLISKKMLSAGDNDEGGDLRDDGGNGDATSTFLSGNASNATRRLLDVPSADIDPQVVYKNLWLFIWLKTIGSFDSGAFSAALGAENGIGNSWELNMAEQGLLTSSVFLGNVFGCPLAGHLFSRYGEKRILYVALIIHTVFTFLFAALPFYSVALVNRFFIGITLSFIVVYTPVWVDEFAPRNRQSVWMASHNAGVPLGVMLGYVLAVGPQMVLTSLGWNWAFFIKCLLMIPTIVYLAQVDSRTINTARAAVGDNKDGGVADASPAAGAAAASAASAPLAEGRGGASGEGGRSSSTSVSARLVVITNNVQSTLAAMREQARYALHTPVDDIPTHLLARGRYLLTILPSFQTYFFCNLVYVCSVVSLTSLYFVATGLQNFVTQYLQEPPFNASMLTIMIGFGSAVVTAPVCGVIAGGILLDRIGGYKRNLRRVTYFLLFWGGCAVFFSVVCIFAETTRSFLLVMSAVLFCGGALIPPGAGLTMASLPDHLRSSGAAFSQTVYNLLGNFSGPLVCGFVAEVTGQLRYGIITLLLSSALGVLPLFGILIVVCRGGPMPSGLREDTVDEAAGGGDAAVEAVLMEEAYEMDDIVGEAADQRLPEAAVASEGITPPPQQQLQKLDRSIHAEKKSEPPLRTPKDDRSTLGRCDGGAAVGDVDLEGAKREGTQVGEGTSAAPGTVVSPPPRTPPATVASVAGASPLSSPPVLHLPQPSPLSGVVRTWTAGRPSIQGPGTVHPVLAPSTAKQPLTRQIVSEPQGSNGSTVTGGGSDRKALQGPTDRQADLELLALESEAAQIASLSNEKPYGLDLVQSWLSTQQ